MENKYKITIPEPCHENWDEMTPNEKGRFCMSCSKTVVDFTSMLPEEMQSYFAEHRNEQICGRFKSSQVELLTIQIPNHVLYSQTHYHKIFLLALFIAMGTTLFSCADKNGNKRKINKIEIIKDTVVKINSFTTETTPKLNDSVQKNTTKKSKDNHIKFAESKAKDCSAITSNDNSQSLEKAVQDDIKEDETVYYTGAAIETSPYFEGGIAGFYHFFSNEFKFPEDVEIPKTRIVVSFVIERDGSLSSFQFPREVDLKIKEEIIRVLSLSPKWIPGEQNGKKTKTKYSLPIAIQT
ncbi:hypothetical protein [Flavobacterium hungaricum]|uniref:TonB C-terminal domain-containing protein n=1 Tax=Flavobacterium hungaricum TaxID=2082725 RepID=A0ABR9TKN8_9FLAO|nr:hypothetical protein [Flavobacterium hungaricum]MBE8725394.1 hypothetical protein [Flavobacterium hungaricum]